MPRSRGVYGGGCLGCGFLVGSSPLARGLRGGSAPPQGADRIIPARAGFTRRPPPEGDVCWDHPRSRGVYRGRKCSPRTRRGSSPLARGLPAAHKSGRIVRRIIPARAGFTYGGERWRWVPRDHPRSRGVYAWPTFSDSVGTGSSPLARGLRMRSRSRMKPLGIIPARAGFTVGAEARSSVHPDHPRSRGVYLSPTSSMALAAGSSPLARGLLPPR